MCVLLERTIELLRERLDQILLLSRENSLPPAQRRSLAVRGLLEAALAVVVRPGVSISIDCPVGLILHGDPTYLTLALQTALRNAIAAVGHMPADHPAEIMYEVWLQDGRIIISIADTGPGFAPELLCAFVTHRAPDGRLLVNWLGQVSGHGIGLLLIDWVARMHAGQVQIGNRARGGAEVRIELPG